MKKPSRLIPVLAILGLSFYAPSCKKETIKDAVVKTIELTASKDAAIFNGTTAYDVDGVDGDFNDHGCGGSDLLRVGYSDDKYFLMRTLLGFDVSSIPASAKILSATLVLTLAKSGNNAPPVFVYKLTQDWTEGSTREDIDDDCTWSETYCSTPGVLIDGGTDATWSHATFSTTTWTTVGGAFTSTASASVSNGGIASFSSQGLIDDVKAWVTTPASNFGWLLKVDETTLTNEGGEQIRYFSKDAAANGATAETKPRLIILYQE